MVPTIISVCIAAVSLIFVVLTFAVNRSNDSKQETREEDKVLNEIKESTTKTELKLDMLTTVINEIRADLKLMNNRVQDLEKELGIVKRDLVTAFKKIDAIEGRRGDR